MVRFQATIIVCQECGNTHTIVPLREGVNYYEFTYVRDKGVSSDIFFMDNKQMKCRGCGKKDFSIFYKEMVIE